MQRPLDMVSRRSLLQIESHYRLLLALAFCFLLTGCLHRPVSDQQQVNEALRVKAHDELALMNKTKSYGSDVQQYVSDCSQSNDFNVRARLVPILYRAVDLKLVDRTVAEAKFREMLGKSRGSEESEFWKAALTVVSQRGIPKS